MTRMRDIATVEEFERYQAERRTRWQSAPHIVRTPQEDGSVLVTDTKLERQWCEPGPPAGWQSGGNLDFNVPVMQPAERATSGGESSVSQPNRMKAMDQRRRAALTSKYGNTKTDGYDSKREAKRAGELRLMQQAGEITGLREKLEYILIPRQLRADGTVAERACTYTADFVYIRAGELVVEDVKGFPNDRWAIKRKLMLLVHQIAVREV